MEDASRVVGGLKYLTDVLAIELRNLEALGLAQQKMIEGAGALLQHQAGMAGDLLGKVLDAKALATAATSPQGPGGALVSQITAMKTSMLEGQANANVLSEVAARSGGEVANILHRRMMDALDELKAAVEQAFGLAPPPSPAMPTLTAQPAPVA
ncbi:MAG: hypothetical protein JOY64_14405 [Alphaproteobacteria bacterium]|nr:hypothetical protein [Alphaproteobacteria bacterium]